MEALELNVAGMHCDGCEGSITRALSRIEGVTAVRADHATGKVVIEVSAPVARAEVASAIEDAGYDVVPDGQNRLPLV